MEMTEVRSGNFTIIPNDNKRLYHKNPAFNILHVYIVERVRSFDKQNKTCYIKNEQLAEATGSSEKTISRAIRLLVDEKILWAGYHYQTENDKITKQRILRIYNESIDSYHQKKEKEMDKMSVSNETKNLSDGQNVQASETNCPPQMDKMTSLDGQNDQLVYKDNIKEYNYKKGEELNSSFLDSHNAHPESHYEPFNGLYSKLSGSKRRSLEEIENEASLEDEI